MKKTFKIRVITFVLGLSLTLSNCGRNSSVQDKDERYVVVLSVDGFRADYQTLANTPNLDQMDKDGLSGKFRPSYPTLTFPNHYAMATGLYPNNNGIVANEFWTKEDKYYRLGLKEAIENPIFYLGEPIWNTAQKQGLKTGSYFWVGSETLINSMRPTYWKEYNPRDKFISRADSVISWLNKEEEARPHLIMWYLSEPDHNGHSYGPNSPQTKKSIEEVDGVIGYFREKLSQLAIADKVNFIIVSDHGMQEFDDSRRLNLADYISDEQIEHISAGPFTHIYPKKGYTEQVFKQLKGVKYISVYHKEDLPARLHYGSSDRIGEIVAIAELGARVYYNPNGSEPLNSLRANHGFDNANEEMYALFKAVGPDFQKGKKLEEAIPNITLYPLICNLLHIKPAPNDADEDLAKSLIDKK